MSNFAYGDSCRTGDDKYVIAQFRFDASLSWVVDLRSYLSLPELKYKFFYPRLYQIQSKTELWKNVEQGVYQAEMTITDPRVYKRAVILTFFEQQAEPGIDFDQRTVNEEAARWMIEGSPLRLADSVTIDWAFENPHLEGDVSFASGIIHKRAGGKLSDTIVLSTRSHAMLSPAETRELASINALRGGLHYGLALAKIARMSRMWDVEHRRVGPYLMNFPSAWFVCSPMPAR